MFFARRDQIEALAWDRQSALSDRRWCVAIDAATRDELRAFIAALPDPVDDELLRRISPAHGELPRLAALAAQTRRLKLRGQCVGRLRGLGDAAYSVPGLR